MPERKPRGAKNALATPDTAMVARPSWLPVEAGTAGTEHIGKDDITPPRLTLAQSLSDEMDNEHPKYMEELREAQMFNNLTQEIYGNELLVSFVRADPPRFIEFYPRDEGGGVKEMNIDPNDPRTRFQDGKPPLAQKFYDFLVVLHPFDEATVTDRTLSLSFKSTGLKTAARLNYFIKTLRAPLFAGKYQLRSNMTRNKKGRYAEINVNKAGWISEEEAKLLGPLFEAMRDAPVVYDRGDEGREPGSDDDNPPF